jgi:hypothetical protein
MPRKSGTIAEKLKIRRLARHKYAEQKANYCASASSQASASSHHPDPVQISSGDELATGALGIVSLMQSFATAQSSQTKDSLQKEEIGKDHAQVVGHWKKDQKVNLFRSDKACKQGETATYETAYEKSESTTVRRLEGYGTKLLGNI